MQWTQEIPGCHPGSDVKTVVALCYLFKVAPERRFVPNNHEARLGDQGTIVLVDNCGHDGRGGLSVLATQSIMIL